MKRRLSLLLLGFTWTWVASHPLGAQESVENELEMVRQLNNKKWYDLAKVKMEELIKRNDPKLNAVLPLELVRINLALALQQDPAQRLTVYSTARTQLQDIMQKNRGKVQAAYASIELAHLDSAHGQTLLIKAMREESAKQRHEQARPAEAMFQQAGKDFAEAITAVELALKDPSSANFKADLEEKLPLLKLESAINLFNQGRTYLNRGNFKIGEERANLMSKAMKAFEELEQKEKDKKVGFLAMAWLMKSGMETSQPNKIAFYYNALANKAKDKNNAKVIHEAHLWAEYFWMQDKTLPRPDDAETIGENPDNEKIKGGMVERLKLVKAKGLDLQKKNANLIQSDEGQGILFELAYAYLNEARMGKDAKATEPLYVQAENLFEKLAARNSELGDRARQISRSMKFRRVDSKGEMITFDDFMMKALIEKSKVIAAASKLDQANLDKEKTKALELERKQHLKEVIKAYSTAIALATPQTPVKEVDEARYFLCGAYLANSDPFRAAIVAESLARTRPPTGRSPDGAAIAIQTYSALQSKFPDNPTLRRRLEDLAQYVLSEESQRAWKDDPVTSLARYHLAMSADRKGDFKKAIEYLEKLAPSFMDYNYTQGQLVFIALKGREKAFEKKEQLEYVLAAKKAMERMTKLHPKEDSPSVVAMYFYAKMEMAKFLYAEAMDELNARQELKAVKKCTEMAAYVKDLQAEFNRIPGKTISSENQEQISFSMQVMLKYADLGVAEVRFRSDEKDRFDQVIAATKNVVEDMLQKAKASKGDEPIRLKDYRLTGDILGLAVRAYVQKGDVTKGKAILDVLKRLNGLNPKEDASSAGAVVAFLLNDISTQVRRMGNNKNDPALKATRNNYLAFLEEITKEYDARGWDNTAAMLIGHTYSSLETPCKAVYAFGKVKPIAALEKKVDKKTPPKEADDATFKKEQEERQKWEEEIRQYWGAQVEYMRALRGCKEKDSYKTAEKILATLLVHPNARFQIPAMMERNLFLEEEGRYREAYVEWSQKFLKQPSLLKDLANKDVQKIYFPGYFYMTRCLFKMSVHDKTLKDPQKFLTGAANLIVKLEFANTKDGWNIAGPMFQELLKTEPKLKEEYEKLKAMRKAVK